MSIDRDDMPGLLVTGAVGVGLASYFLRPERVASVIGVASGIGHPTVVLTAWTVALCAMIVGTTVWWWGPVRLSRAEAVWLLSGPADREPIVATRLCRASTAALVGCLAAATGVSILDWSSAPVLLGVAVICACVILATTVARQCSLSAAMSGHRPGHRRRRFAVGRLHRDVFAPDDGFIAAARLAAVTMDLGWLDAARVVRWTHQHTRMRSRAIRLGRVRACLSADLIRLSRRPGDLAVWAVIVAAGFAVAQTLYLTSIGPAVATVIAYRAGCSLAAGLRRLTAEPALRRALGGATAQLTAIHSAIPITGILLCCGVMSLSWHLSTITVIVIAAGSAVATVRRATRPDLPFDAPVYVTGQGGATQPLLLFALARGPLAAAVTGLIAVIIG